jgi:hypothetical protein
VARKAVIAACVLLAAATALRLKRGGGPYFERPATVMDHVGTREHEIRGELLHLRDAARLVPHGATVSVVPDDVPHYLTAVALLPEHRVVRGRGEYVLDVR